MPSETAQRKGVWLPGVIGLAAVYFLVAWFCLKLASVHAAATPVWPPVGLAVGSLIVFGRRYVPAVLLGTFAVSILGVDFGDGAPSFTVKSVSLSTLIGVGNLFEALAGAMLVEKIAAGRRCLDRVRSVFGFVVAGLIAPLISASFGIVSLTLAGTLARADQGAVFLTWYTGNVVGIFTVAPLVIWFGRRRPLIEMRRVGETLIELGAMTALGVMVWIYSLPEALVGLPQVYMAIPLILWAALRLGRPVTLVSILLLSAIAVTATVTGQVTFPGPTPNHSLIYLQIYIGIMSVMALAVGALVAELRATNEGLEEAVEERTVRLERLLRYKDEFLSFTVHELQSPLTGLRNLLGLVRSNPEVLSDSKAGPSELITEMEEATDSMLLHVHELLESQKAMEEVEGYQPAKENLGAILEDCVRAHRPNAVVKDIAIEVELPKSPVEAITVGHSVQHVLGNLISNAVKFSPAGCVVRARLTQPGTSARFEIEDEGPGILEEQVPKLFQKFQRSAAEPTGGESSTGLGLFIAGRMVRELGGRIQCRSGGGKGACFVFDLPLERGASSLGDLPI